MKEHTKGPWSFCKTEGFGKEDRQIVDGNGEVLMSDPQYYPWCPDYDADWDLIAAAPAMLQALQDMLNTLTDGPDESDVARVFAVARAAIKAAKGAA